MRQYYHPLEWGRSYLYEMCPNITQMSAERYDYYVNNAHGGFVGKGTTWVLLIGSTHKNETTYLSSILQFFHNRVFNESGSYNISENELRFAVIEPRYDEPLSEGFDLRRWPSLYVIDPDSGMTYAWDSYNWANNETIEDWVLNKKYL